MTFRDTVGLAFRNLRQAKLRTALTTLGVAIGIASLSGMVSLGVGLQDQFVGRFTKSGMFDAITVLPPQPLPVILGGTGRRGGVRPFGGAGPAAEDSTRVELNDEALKQLAAFEHVRDVYPILRVPFEAKYGDRSEFVLATGVPMTVRDEGAFQSMAFGSFFANESDTACLLSLDLAKRIDERDPGKLVGQEMTLTYAIPPPGGVVPIESPLAIPIRRVEARYRIVGIVERETGPGPPASVVSGLMIPMARARTISAELLSAAPAAARSRTGGRVYQTATVRVTHAQRTPEVQDRIKKMGYSAFSLNDAVQGAKRAFIILDIVLSLIGSIALAVSSLGIMNTMVMSILERTREIGIMKAIGGSDGDVRRIFLIEASAIGLLGGISGVVLGWGVGRAINFGANIYIRNQGGTPGNLFSLPLWLIGGAIGFSIAISLIAGSYPAARAARLDPIQALRHD